MADEDIEEYLKKVEDDIFHKENNIKPKISIIRSSTLDDEEINTLLDEIDINPTNCDGNNQVQKVSRSLSEDYQKSFKKGYKCFPLLVGAADTHIGLSTIPNARTCDTLRCLTCDHSVIAMPHSAWHSDTDTLFLRQAAVNPSQLELKLEPYEGARAYACQCQCITIYEGTKSIPRHLTWVCGKHVFE